VLKIGLKTGLNQHMHERGTGAVVRNVGVENLSDSDPRIVVENTFERNLRLSESQGGWMKVASLTRHFQGRRFITA
jgi:hypothetical protein